MKYTILMILPIMLFGCSFNSNTTDTGNKINQTINNSSSSFSWQNVVINDSKQDISSSSTSSISSSELLVSSSSSSILTKANIQEFINTLNSQQNQELNGLLSWELYIVHNPGVMPILKAFSWFSEIEKELKETWVRIYDSQTKWTQYKCEKINEIKPENLIDCNRDQVALSWCYYYNAWDFKEFSQINQNMKEFIDESAVIKGVENVEKNINKILYIDWRSFFIEETKEKIILHWIDLTDHCSA